MSTDDEPELTQAQIVQQREGIVRRIEHLHDRLSEYYSELDILQSKCEHPGLQKLLILGQPVAICPDCSWQDHEAMGDEDEG